MGNSNIQTTLVTRGASSGLVNLTNTMTEVILALALQYAPGLTTFYKGLRPLSAESINIPCIMVQPMGVKASMNTTAKFHKYYTFDIWYVVGGESIEEAVEKCTSIAEIFIKLFSNDALNDQGSGHDTNSFKKYSNSSIDGVNWLDSEMSRVEWSVPFLSGRPGGPKYVAWGNFQLTTETQNLV